MELDAPLPPGLCALYKVCNRLYPDQLNPLQVSAVVKFWLGGPDPLDYISIYSHPGDPKQHTPPHWHYVSFGLSDLHGDGRVYSRPPPVLSSDTPSGLGVELTFRLRRAESETDPPLWPAQFLQCLAKYIVQTGNLLVTGDHIAYYRPLDSVFPLTGSKDSSGEDAGCDSFLRHVIVCEDAALSRVVTCHGRVQFLQLVGAMDAELMAVRQWNGEGVLDLLRHTPGVGGTLLVSDMSRDRSVFDLSPEARHQVNCGVDVEGSALSGVSAHLAWTPAASGVRAGNCHISDRSITHSHTQSVCCLAAVDIWLNLEAARTLPLALRGRLKHGRHFTYKSVCGQSALTLVTEDISGALCSETAPIVAHSGWLHVHVSAQLLDRMLCDLVALTELSALELELPRTFSWPENNLSITVTEDPDS